MKKTIIALLLFLTFIYLYFQSNSIYGGDAGELVTAAYLHGIPHAPGFPFYTFLGYFISHLIPFSTIAWRVSLLSSIPAVISRLFLFLTLKRMTKSTLLSLTGALLYSFLYPVWLFSEVPEVVSFNILFQSILVYLATVYLSDKKRLSVIPLIILTASFALFHNYIVILLFPGLLYIFRNAQTKQYIVKHKIKLFLACIVGALPYTYSIIASRTYPILDSEHSASVIGLIKLITRYSFGTFRLSQGIYFNFNSAINNAVNLLNFIRIDFKWLGIICIVLGMIYSFQKKRKLFLFLGITVLCTILFFGYASFPLELNYHLGTFEKYLPILYFYLSIFVILGILHIQELLQTHVQNYMLRKGGIGILYIVGILFVGIFFSNNYQKILLLKNDFTAENLGRDILASAPQKSIMNLGNDTSDYNSLYVHEVLKERPDIVIINFSGLKNQYYREYLSLRYPEIVLPSVDLTNEIFLKNFLCQTRLEMSAFSRLSSMTAFPLCLHG